MGTVGAWCAVSDLIEADQLDPSVNVESAIAAASQILFLLSGRQWSGLQADVVRPTSRWVDNDKGRPSSGGYGYGWGYSASPIWQRSWGLCVCNRTYRSGCSSVPEITLGGTPIASIEQIREDGVILDPSTYRVDDDRWLVRLPNADGSARGWHCCQSMISSPDEPNTFEVQYHYGRPPDEAGKRQAATLAYQLALGASPSTATKSRLPTRITSVTRQGMTMIVLDPMQFLREGHTGLYEVDLWLTAVNRVGLVRRSTISSPDLPERVRRAGTPG